jgi:RNA polymerase sigma-70 factor (ECF subfamily)
MESAASFHCPGKTPPVSGTRQAMAPPEDELIERARSGDTASFEALYRLACGKVYALCLRMCGSRSLAEDLTQEAFVRAWRNLPSFRGESAFSTWMHRLAVNVVLGYQRGEGRKLSFHTELDEWQQSGSARAPEAPSATVDLERAIATLPHRARQVFVLHDVEGYRHHEIAEMASMAVGTSKAHLNRARRLLREALSS